MFCSSLSSCKGAQNIRYPCPVFPFTPYCAPSLPSYIIRHHLCIAIRSLPFPPLLMRSFAWGTGSWCAPSWRTLSPDALLLNAPSLWSALPLDTYALFVCSFFMHLLSDALFHMTQLLSLCAHSWCNWYLDALLLITPSPSMRSFLMHLLSWCALSLQADPDLMRSLLPPLFFWCVLFLDAPTLYASTLDAPSWSIPTDRQTNVVFYFINCLKIR